MASINVSRNLLAPGIKSFRSFVQSELNALRQTPILLISSEVGASSPNLKPVADSCQWVRFTLGQQFGMRTVPTTISSAFPTKDSLDQTLELMQRTGASSVVSVGSGAAMDLAKAVATTVQADQEKEIPLILIPGTYGGLLSAGASHSLFLDGDEDTLVPLPHRHQKITATVDGTNDNSSKCAATVATLDSQKYMEHLDEEKFDVLLHAVSAIILDAGSRKSMQPSLPNLLQATIDLIALRNSPEWDKKGKLMEAIPSLSSLLYQSAGLISYGLSDGFEEEDDRSITIALGSSLIPTLFPETHPLSFLASLVPGLCHYYSLQDENATTGGNDRVRANFRTLVQQLQERPSPPLETKDESLQGFSVPDMAVSQIQANQTVWKPSDVSDDVLLQVLQHSLEH